MRTVVRCEVYPTEDLYLVVEAVRALFGPSEVRVSTDPAGGWEEAVEVCPIPGTAPEAKEGEGDAGAAGSEVPSAPFYDPTRDPDWPDRAGRGTLYLEARPASLTPLANAIRNQRIRDSAREALEGCAAGGRITVRLNKQVATVGKVSFAHEAHALGDLLLTIECGSDEAMEAVLDLLAAPTIPREARGRMAGERGRRRGTIRRRLSPKQVRSAVEDGDLDGMYESGGEGGEGGDG